MRGKARDFRRRQRYRYWGLDSLEQFVRTIEFIVGPIHLITADSTHPHCAIYRIQHSDSVHFICPNFIR